MNASEEPLERKPLYYLDERADRKIIVSLLHEYSAKLMDLSVEIEGCKYIKRRLELLISTLIASFISLFTWSVLNHHSQNTWILGLSTICGSYILTFVIANINDNTRKIRFLERNGKILFIKLEKLVRMVSQMEDHTYNNPVKRIEFDLRLTDAESVLERYKYAVGMSYSKFF